MKPIKSQTIIGFPGTQEEVLESLQKLGDKTCGYSGDCWPRRCDCKYGGPTSKYGEGTGCPELATTYWLIKCMTPEEYKSILARRYLLINQQSSDTVSRLIENKKGKHMNMTIPEMETESKSLLRAYLKNPKNPFTSVTGSKARWATAAQLSKVSKLTAGWIGRSLNNTTGVVTKTDDSGRTAYRLR